MKWELEQQNLKFPVDNKRRLKQVLQLKKNWDSTFGRKHEDNPEWNAEWTKWQYGSLYHKLLEDLVRANRPEMFISLFDEARERTLLVYSSTDVLRSRHLYFECYVL